MPREEGISQFSARSLLREHVHPFMRHLITARYRKTLRRFLRLFIFNKRLVTQRSHHPVNPSTLRLISPFVPPIKSYGLVAVYNDVPYYDLICFMNQLYASKMISRDALSFQPRDACCYIATKLAIIFN